MKERKISTVNYIFLIAVVLFSLLFANDTIAQGQHSFSIIITSPSGGTVFNPVQVSGSVSSTNFVGLLSQYTVRINWGDGSALTDLTQDSTHLILTQSGNDFTGTYTTSSDLAHTYATSGPFTITALLCHQSCTGAEGADASATVTITIAPPTTCGITASSDPSFGSTTTGTITPSDSGASAVSTTITNTGTASTTSLTIQGTEWKIGGTTASDPIPFVVGSTHHDDVAATVWSSMDVLTNSDTTIPGHAALGNGDSFNLYFRVKPPLGVDAGIYNQDITFTSTC